MDPNLHTSPGLHLPQPSQGAPLPNPQAAVSTQPAGVPMSPVTPPAAQPTAMAPAQSNADLSEAQLDEEWVGKAKEVTDHYRTDPYMQTRELAALKAQYLKARYGKEVKTGKDQT